ncbi:uncharacterized protein LOC117777165 [Hippoglossus hippoglossus]|uniref:uncharacterized protein LOC117777165 n=1 Tax=Hippoglossus hippoglossus TaxID=8267 RepID=UPI00148E0FBB|nr:uncharacterized protein LOC117777165 [Hippoglossus hippoglossus]
MASTPSASALSAVLRCRGNIWARNPPTKRPASAGCSLGLAAGARRDPPAERNRPNRPSAWEVGERAAVGGRLTVTCASPQADGNVLRGKDFSEINKSYDPKLSRLAPGVQNALVRSLTHKLKSNLPVTDKCSRMIQVIECETYAAHICNFIPLKGSSELPAAVWKVSITSPCLNAGQLSLVRTGLKSPCVSLTALLSHFMSVRLVVWRRSDDSPLSQQEEKSLNDEDLQENGQILSSTSLTSSENNCGQRVTEDRPD